MTIQIDRRDRLTRKQFLSGYAVPQRPVILTDAIAHWPALGKWSLDYFRTRFGKKQIVFDRKTWPLDGFIDELARHGDGEQGAAPYLKEVKLDEQFPELWPDVSGLAVGTGNLLDSRWLPRSMRLDRGKTALFIGSKGSGFRKLHWDYSKLHVFISQVHGPKDVILFRPTDTPYLYPNPEQDNTSLIPDPYAVDATRFPEYSRADPVRFTIQEGETLFIPAGWWHATQINQPSIAIAESYLDASNWSLRRQWYMNSYARAGVSWAKRQSVNAYLSAVGMAAWAGQWLGLMLEA